MWQGSKGDSFKMPFHVSVHFAGSIVYLHITRLLELGERNTHG